MRLERSLAILVVSKVEEEFLDGLAESLVLWVLIELVGKELYLIQDAVGVIAVAVTEQKLSLVVEVVPLFGR